MRPLPSPAPAAEFQIHLSPPPSTKCDVQKCPWQPYSNSRDFRANTILVLVFLLCTLICGLAINLTIKHLCMRRRRRIQEPEIACAEAEKETEIPALIYTEGMKLASECAICLSEFVVGDRLRVLEQCSHGFHMQCIERWLIFCSSCPICRANSR